MNTPSVPASKLQHTPSARAGFADPREMQNRLFAQLSANFAKEVPLYGGSLDVNLACNLAACDLLAQAFPGFSMTADRIEEASGERHGAIRIGTPEEYRWVARFFHLFGMEPHNFYDMSRVGAKSQPVVATAFRSRERPEHRVFSSLLLIEYFDDDTRKRIEHLLSQRRVWTDRAKELIERGERQGGLSSSDSEALIEEAVNHIFKWTGTARDFALYNHLCDAGFKIAADIACFEAHHLNHLTPNTFCMDLYTGAMEYCLGEIGEGAFRERARRALTQMIEMADADYLRLHFKHLTAAEVARFGRAKPGPAAVDALVDRLVAELAKPPYRLADLDHSGFKDFTEGPDAGTPVFLRQDAYKALSEPVVFRQPDGTTVKASHTARFGEIEQRFFAATPEGRSLYQRCNDAAEAARDQMPDPSKDHAAFQAAQARFYEPIPKTLRALLKAGLVFGEYAPTAKGLAEKGRLPTSDIHELVRLGYVDVEGIRYEDFLPVSAAGIFASNLNQYGTRATAANPPVFTRERMEGVIGRPIIEADEEYRRRREASIVATQRALGIGAVG
ncbi:MAG: VOC family protein [Phycisphaeraceae bacterium]|nr:VOC family protein [Phycisphaeraceae bacterium]